MTPIYVTANGKTTVGKIEVREIPQAERVQRGMKIGGALLVAAIVSVFVPVLHFILVPGFLILGLVFGFTTYLTRSEVLEGQFDCPVCGQLNELPKQSLELPCGRRCLKCHYDLTLNSSPVTPTGAS